MFLPGFNFLVGFSLVQRFLPLQHNAFVRFLEWVCSWFLALQQGLEEKMVVKSSSQSYQAVGPTGVGFRCFRGLLLASS